MNRTDLSLYSNASFRPGASRAKRIAWYLCSTIFVASRFPWGGLKRRLLSAFGAVIGKGVVIKPGVNIKSPWLLEIGAYAWIGENVWIDNLVRVKIGDNACLSQGAMLLTGSHNYKKPTFDLITGEISVGEGVWLGARSTVCPGVACGSHAVLTVGSVATRHLEPYGIYQGNPAVKTRERVIG